MRAFVRKFAFLAPSLYELQQSWRYRSSIFRRSVVHESDFFYFRRYASESPLFLDIGANTGQSIASLKRVVPRAQIVSFEPNRLCFKKITRFGKCLTDITIFNCALSSRPGRLVLHIPSSKGLIFSQLASLHPPVVSQVAAKLRQNGFSFVTATNLVILHQHVDVLTIDSFGLKPKIIKLDVEGSELEVLEGASETLQRTRPILLIENGLRPDLVRHVTRLGYCAFSYDLSRDELCPPQQDSVNTFFLPR